MKLARGLWMAGAQRYHARAKAPPALRALARAAPSWRTLLRDLEFLALDLETSGLDPRRDEVLSVGWVVLRQGRVKLASARYHLVCPTRPISAETCAIHHIFDDLAARGRPWRAVFAAVLEALTGRVLVAHNMGIEWGFLSAMARRCHGAGFYCPRVDTLALERRRHARPGRQRRAGDLRLDAARARYGLPCHRAHHALSDAVATAELLLAQIAYAGTPERLRLIDLAS
ncbi:MAG: exonuclease domain-containing protein [Pseudomonadota bacterium]